MGNSQSNQNKKTFKITSRSIAYKFEQGLWIFGSKELKQCCEISNDNDIAINNIDELLQKNNDASRELQKALRSEYLAIKLHLDDYVEYENGSYKYIEIINKSPFSDYKTGNYLKINLTEAKKINSKHPIGCNFPFIGLRVIALEEERIKRDATENFLDVNMWLVEELGKHRERYEAIIEQRRLDKLPERWTSWNIPPK